MADPQLRFPNEPLPPFQLNLEALVNLYKAATQRFNNSPEDEDRLEKLVNCILCGRWPEPSCRMVLNVAQGLDPISLHDCQVSRDIDSIIGISDTLPYTSPMAVFPIPSFKETLTTDVHLKGLACVNPVSPH